MRVILKALQGFRENTRSTLLNILQQTPKGIESYYTAIIQEMS